MGVIPTLGTEREEQMSDVRNESKKLFPTAWAWYVKDNADVVGEEPPKTELDELITFLLDKAEGNIA